MGFLRDFFGLLAAVLNIVAALPYLKGVVQRKTKPHFITWLIWGMTGLINLAAQLISNAGAATWTSIVGLTICFTIAAFGFFIGEKTITRGDWSCLIFALLAVPLWILTRNPLYSVILITLIDLIGYYPTFRKAYLKPYEEPITPYVLGGIGRLFSVLAVNQFIPVNWIYSGAVVFANTALITLIALRRTVIKKL
jgi:hypothetical protein